MLLEKYLVIDLVVLLLKIVVKDLVDVVFVKIILEWLLFLNKKGFNKNGCGGGGGNNCNCNCGGNGKGGSYCGNKNYKDGDCNYKNSDCKNKD